MLCASRGFVKLLLSVSVGVFFLPHSAEAGFGWTPAPAQQQQAASPSLPPVPPISQEMLNDAPLAPLPSGVMDGVSVVPMLSELPVPLGTETEFQAPPVGMNSIPAKPAAIKMDTVPPVVSPSPTNTVSIPSAPVLSASVIEGFGKDIPLVMALRDIVPAGYAFSFGAANIAGQKISWEGGKPWSEVLADSLSAVGLAYSLQGNVLMITSREMVVDAPSVSVPIAADQSVPYQTLDVARPSVEPNYLPQSAETPSPRGIVSMEASRKWEARPGKTLRETLDQWCKESNVVLKWMTAYDYPINNAFYFNGTYGEAVDSLLSSYGGESPAPRGRLYPNLPDGPSVLMVN